MTTIFLLNYGEDMITDTQKKLDAVAQNLINKHYKVHKAESVDEARIQILNIIGKDDIVGVGGSLTIRAVNIIEALISRGNKVIQHWLPEATVEEVKEARRQAVRLSDVYLTSTNAITLAGDLINIDTYGNRVAAMIYGPKKVIIVAGYNKIMENTETAFAHIRDKTAVRNAMRLKIDNPKGFCKVATIIYDKPTDTDITIILINNELGF